MSYVLIIIDSNEVVSPLAQRLAPPQRILGVEQEVLLGILKTNSIDYCWNALKCSFSGLKLHFTTETVNLFSTLEKYSIEFGKITLYSHA